MNIKKFNVMIKEIEKEKEIERLSDIDMTEIQMYFDKPIHPIHEMTDKEKYLFDGMNQAMDW